VIIGGDFNNTVAGRLAVLDAMKATGFAHAPGADHGQTSIRHRHPIDWIFQKGTVRWVMSSMPLTTPITIRLSRRWLVRTEGPPARLALEVGGLWASL